MTFELTISNKLININRTLLIAGKLRQNSCDLSYPPIADGGDTLMATSPLDGRHPLGRKRPQTEMLAHNHGITWNTLKAFPAKLKSNSKDSVVSQS